MLANHLLKSSLSESFPHSLLPPFQGFYKFFLISGWGLARWQALSLLMFWVTYPFASVEPTFIPYLGIWE